jgi:hypothetical protein
MPTVVYNLSSARKRGKKQLILVETSAPGNVPRNASKAMLEKAAGEIEQQLKPLAKVAEAVRDALVAANNPGKIEVEFGVELGGQMGLPLVTSGSAKANFKITLVWTNEKEPNQ